MPRLHAHRARPSLVAAVALCAGLVSARPLSAQIDPGADAGGPSASAAAAYTALTLTPVGAFAPSADYMLARPGAAPRPMRVHGRFGSMDRGPGASQHAWGLTLDMPAGGAALSITGGMVDVRCSDLEEMADPNVSVSCKGGYSFGARFGSSFFSRSLDAAGTSALVLGAEATAGYADVRLMSLIVTGTPFDVDIQALTATAALPIALAVRSGAVTVAPMLVPRLGWGHGKASAGGVGVQGDSDSKAGGRFMLGAGVAVRFGARMGFDAGMQKVFIDEGDTAYGVGISLGF